jgi:hypothetical protein
MNSVIIDFALKLRPRWARTAPRITGTTTKPAEQHHL